MLLTKTPTNNSGKRLRETLCGAKGRKGEDGKDEDLESAAMTISCPERTGDRKKARPNINLGDSRESITIFPHRKNLKHNQKNSPESCLLHPDF